MRLYRDATPLNDTGPEAGLAAQLGSLLVVRDPVSENVPGVLGADQPAALIAFTLAAISGTTVKRSPTRK